MGTKHDPQERAIPGPLLRRAPADGRAPVLGVLGEGLLEVGIASGLGEDQLGRGFGGDAANVTVMAARMGTRSRLLTRVGDDAVGRLLMDFWRDSGVDVTRVGVDAEAATGLYVNEGLDHGRHSFAYYRTNSAASRIAPEDVDHGALAEIDLLHLSGITLAISPTAAAAADRAVEAARTTGARVAFDFNYRERLAADPDAILAMARRADVVLLASTDAEAVLGSSSPSEVLGALGPVPREVLITHGGDEALLFTSEASFALVPPVVEVANAAGAGDALAGAYLASRLGGGAPGDALAVAVAAASISCRRTGCARSYPAAPEVEAEAAILSPEIRPPVSQMAAEGRGWPVGR